MVDFHSHVLPYLDDGARNFDMALNMLRISQGEEIEYICATPHFIPGEFELDRKALDIKLDNLSCLGSYKKINIKLIPGLEIYMDPELPKLYRGKKIWGLNDSRYVLIELPMQEVPIYTEEVLYRLRLLGAIPIIAHPERNLALRKSEDTLVKLLEQGNFVQINAGSLKGLYGKRIKSFAEHLVKNNMVNFLGSDGHNDGMRNTGIADAIESVKRLNPELYQWMELNSLKVIQNAEVNPLNVRETVKRVCIKKVFWKKRVTVSE